MSSDLLAEIDDFLRRRDVDLTETAFGLAAMKDGKFIPNLRDGRRVWPENQAKVRAYMRDYKPGASQDTVPEQARAS